MIKSLTGIRHELERNNIQYSKINLKITVHSMAEKVRTLDAILPKYNLYNDFLPTYDGDAKISNVSITIEVLDRRKVDRRK